MPMFIRMRREQSKDASGTIVLKDKPYTKSELRRLYSEDPSLFLEVPESHAAETLRPQGNYQEVDKDALTPKPKQRPNSGGLSKGGAGRADQVPVTNKRVG